MAAKKGPPEPRLHLAGGRGCSCDSSFGEGRRGGAYGGLRSVERCPFGADHRGPFLATRNRRGGLGRYGGGGDCRGSAHARAGALRERPHNLRDTNEPRGLRGREPTYSPGFRRGGGGLESPGEWDCVILRSREKMMELEMVNRLCSRA